MRQIRFFFVLVLIVFVLACSPGVDYAQPSVLVQPSALSMSSFLGTCTHIPNSDLYRPDGVVVRYQFWGKSLVLVSITSGSVVQMLESSFTTSDLADLDWSPDCHYLFGTANRAAIIWDVLNGGRVATFSSILPKNPPYWNPTRPSLILEAHGGSYLWNFTQAAPLLLDFSGHACSSGYLYFNWQVEWDNARNQVLVAPNYAGGSTVVAYDQTTAQQLAAYDNNCLGGPVKFSLIGDDVIVFTSESEANSSHEKALTVWNRDTLQHVTVNANNQSAVLPTQVALSPDGRYLVLARIGTLRVWDLTSLAAEVSARNPIHRYQIEATTESVRFVSPTIVETTDFYGKTTRRDVVSGDLVS